MKKSKIVSIDFFNLPWKLESEESAPKNVPVITQSPGGSLCIHQGRELLKWTQWITLEDFNRFIHTCAD